MFFVRSLLQGAHSAQKKVTVWMGKWLDKKKNNLLGEDEVIKKMWTMFL
jgi:hypothetical protein